MHQVDPANAIKWTDFGVDPILLSIGPFDLRWYSLAYLAGIFIGYWYLLRLIAKPGAPMARRHADDMVFYAAMGIILGGRLGYAIFYKPSLFTGWADSGWIRWELLRLWDGGMSLHGGVLGTTLSIIYLSRKEKLNWLRVHDYVACCAPFGLFFGRLANFVNSELWGAKTGVPWAIRFCTRFDPDFRCLELGPPRHPSQLYEAAMEGIFLFAILAFLFWKTNAKYEPGKLVGAFIFFYGIFRFGVEFVREPDAELAAFAHATGLHMGQWLSIPMILGGIYLMATAKARRVRVEGIAGTESVA